MLALQRVAGNRAVSSLMASGQTSPQPLAAGTAVQRDLWSGIGDIAGGVKDRVLGSVADQAKSVPGYKLLTTVIGQDPITDRAVDRSGAALIDGFLEIVPGSDRIRQPLQDSHAIERAGSWFDEEVPKLGLTFAYIKSLVMRVVQGLSASDVLNPSAAIARVLGIFAEPIRRLTAFASGAVRTLMSFIVEGAMALAGDGGAVVMGIIRRAGASFDRIIADPMGFLANLIAAAKGGFLAFASNIGTHLKNGLVAWLTGSLGGVLRIPAKFDLPGILTMAMDFLGITWARVRGKIVKFIPEPILAGLESAAGLIADVRERGLSAITDKIAEFADGLIGMVMGAIREWVTNTVVGQAITKLVSFFNPAGAIVQAAIAIYNTVMFFVERGRQIAAMAEAMFDSIEAIASGAIGGAVAKVETALGRSVPVLLGFLARLVGLGDIATPVKKVITDVQSFIDRALDKAVGWIAGVAKKLVGRLGLGRRERERRPSVGLEAALGDAQMLLGGQGATFESVRAGLPALRERHHLARVELHTARRRPGAFQILLQRETVGTSEIPLPGGKPGHARDDAGMPLAGRIGSYRDLEGIQDKRSREKPELAVYREHLIPRRIVAELGMVLGGAGAPRSGADYAAMTTILMYATAKGSKDIADSRLQPHVDAVKAEAGGESSVRRKLALLEKVTVLVGTTIAGLSIDAATTASVSDPGHETRGTTGDVRPSTVDIQRAAGQQLRQIADILNDAAESGSFARDVPDDAFALALAVAGRYGGGRPDTHANVATRIPLGPHGGSGGGDATLTINDRGWSVRARGVDGARTPIHSRESALAAIGAEIEKLRADNAASPTFTATYRSRVVAIYTSVSAERPGTPKVRIAEEVLARLPGDVELTRALGRSTPPAATTIIGWVMDHGA